MNADQTTNMKQLIDSITAMAKEVGGSKAPTAFNLPGKPGYVTHYWDHAASKLVEYVSPIPDRRYTASDVADLSRLVNEFSGRLPEPEKNVSFVWVNDGSVVVVIDEKGDRRERIVLNLARFGGFDCLKTISGKWLGQSEMIETLRSGINGEYAYPGQTAVNLVALLRKIKFKQNADGKSEVASGRASLGRSIEAEVVGIDGTSFPDEVNVTLPVYDDFLRSDFSAGDSGNACETFTVACTFDVNLQEQTFKLAVKAGEIRRVLLDADTRLQQRIAAGVTTKNVQIYRGKPE